MTFTSLRDPIVLTSQRDPVTGQDVFAPASEAALPAGPRPRMRDLALVEGGKIAAIPESGTSLIQVSRLPEERMAATWEDIARTLHTAEDGRPGAVDVELRPGGELVLTGREQAPRPLSQLPKGRMA
jgi:hypothetical protein